MTWRKTIRAGLRVDATAKGTDRPLSLLTLQRQHARTIEERLHLNRHPCLPGVAPLRVSTSPELRRSGFTRKYEKVPMRISGFVTAAITSSFQGKATAGISPLPTSSIAVTWQQRRRHGGCGGDDGGNSHVRAGEASSG
eukprot:792654-Pleurochrysis_carterae.AAC.1